MVNQIMNHKAKEFFQNLIDEKIELKNESFREALELQKEAMIEIAENNNDDIERAIEIVIDRVLSSEDFLEYAQHLNKEENLKFSKDFDIVEAQNDRADMCAAVVMMIKYENQHKLQKAEKND